MSSTLEVISKRLSKIENHLQSENINSTQERFLSISDAAKFLFLTVGTLYGKVSKNEVPYIKRGNKLYFSTTDLIEYLRAGKVKIKSKTA